jgi:hypothetical protein
VIIRWRLISNGHIHTLVVSYSLVILVYIVDWIKTNNAHWLISSIHVQNKFK